MGRLIVEELRSLTAALFEDGQLDIIEAPKPRLEPC